MFKKKLKDFFIPNNENNFAPHSMQKLAMVGMLFLIVLSFTATNALSLLWISSEWMVGTVLPAVIVDLTNEERSSDALGTLRRNTTLDQAAKLKAEDMAQNEYFAHYSPTGVSPWHWFGKVAYNFVHAGENLAIHFTDSGEVVEAWMESPSHRANIMNGNYTEIGVGTAEGTYQGYQTVYIVQLFGTPSAPTVAQIPSVQGETIALAQGSTTQDEEVLSESVSISETVEVYEAEKVAVVTEEVVVSSEEGDQEAVSTTTPTTTADTTDVMDIATSASGAILYSDFISTSTGGIPATVSDVQGENDTTAPFLLELATQPHTVLQIIYIIIGLFVFVSLMLSIFIEIKKQQPLQVAYGVGLLILMLCLFSIHTILSTGASIV